jgi:hypothetical protein
MKIKGQKPAVNRPGVRYYAKNDPCDPNDPEKKILSKTPGPHHIPGYAGYMPGGASLYGQTYASTSHAALVQLEEAASRPMSASVSVASIDPSDGVIPFQPRSQLPKRHSEFATTARPDHPPAITKHVPGYTGFIPGVVSESTYGKTFAQQSITVLEGDHPRFQHKPLDPDAQYLTEVRATALAGRRAPRRRRRRARASRRPPLRSSRSLTGSHTVIPSPPLARPRPLASQVKDSFRNFGLVVPKHLGVAHEHANSSRFEYMSSDGLSKLTSAEVHHHMPGYGGFVPGVYAANMYGRTFYKASDQALTEFEKHQATLKRPSTAPEKPPVFKSFVPTLRMQDGGLSTSPPPPSPRAQPTLPWRCSRCRSRARDAFRTCSPPSAPRPPVSTGAPAPRRGQEQVVARDGRQEGGRPRDVPFHIVARVWAKGAAGENALPQKPAAGLYPFRRRPDAPEPLQRLPSALRRARSGAGRRRRRVVVRLTVWWLVPRRGQLREFGGQLARTKARLL